MTRLIYFLLALAIGLLLWTLTLAARQLIAVGSPSQVVVEYNAVESAIKISSKVDFANVRVTFDDLPGQYVTVAELRGWVKSRLPVKTP